MSKINVSTITNRTGTSGPVLSGVTTATNGFHVTGGNVGIGTDNPSASLTVGDVTSPATIRGAVAIKSQATGISLPYANIYLEEPDIGDVTGEGYYLSVNSAGDLDFVNSGTVTVLTMSDDNNIGIGVTIPSDKLSVYKDNIGNATGITIRNTNSSSTYSHARLRLESQNGAAYGEIWADVANAGLRLGYNSASTVKINTNGNIVLNNGSGIDFSATGDTAGATSELLDDYEEGTWTPQARDNFSGGNQGTFDLAVGYYTKIGNQVTAWGRFSNANTSGMNGSFDFCVAGLPFAASSNLTFATGTIHTNWITYTGQIAPRIEGARSSFRIQECTSNSSTDYVTVSQVASGTADAFYELSYFV